MSDSDKNRFEGNVDQVTGEAKEKVGDLTGDKDTQAEGKSDQMKGKAKEGLADAKDKLGDLTDGDKKS